MGSDFTSCAVAAGQAPRVARVSDRRMEMESFIVLRNV